MRPHHWRKRASINAVDRTVTPKNQRALAEAVLVHDGRLRRSNNPSSNRMGTCSCPDRAMRVCLNHRIRRRASTTRSPIGVASHVLLGKNPVPGM